VLYGDYGVQIFTKIITIIDAMGLVLETHNLFIATITFSTLLKEQRALCFEETTGVLLFKLKDERSIELV
jgi:hypothetical protein